MGAEKGKMRGWGMAHGPRARGRRRAAALLLPLTLSLVSLCLPMALAQGAWQGQSHLQAKREAEGQTWGQRQIHVQGQGQTQAQRQGPWRRAGERRAEWQGQGQWQGKGQRQAWEYSRDQGDETSDLGTQDTVTQLVDSALTLPTQETGTQPTLPHATMTQDTVAQDTATGPTLPHATVTKDTVTEDTVTRPTLPRATVTQGSYFETHMQRVLGVTEHAELHRRIHEASRNAQEAAQRVAADGTGTSEYLKWRLSMEGEWATEGRSMATLTATGTPSGVPSGTPDGALQPPGLNSAPGLADMNMTVIRHGSIVAPAVVDWRASPALNTGIFDQRQHVCDCGFKKCCGGGWPEWTFQFAQLNKGVAPLSSYPYLAKDNQKCGNVSPSLLTGKITGWEKLPARTPDALMKTLAQHPAVVLIFASRSFMAYKTGVFRGTDCPRTVNVNHALVVLGFNASGPDPYWIAKNSWGTGWGEGGYIRISMLVTVCGFGNEPSMYPTMFRVKTPCDAVPPPCGNGTCYLMADGVTARCACPAGFVERLESSAPKCVTATPCAAPINPCAFGTCSNAFDGTYTCWCPPGTVVGSRADGGETCVVNSFQSGLLTTTAVDGDNCSTVAGTYNLTQSQLLQMNPFLNCSADSLTPGTFVVVGGALSGLGCGGKAVVGPNDTCSTFASRNGISVPQLTGINPGLSCAYPGYTPGTPPAPLRLSQHLCVVPGQLAISSPYERSCGQSEQTELGDTCLSLAMDNNMTITVFEWLNPALDCSRDLPLTTVCVAPLLLGNAGVQCAGWYNITQADTCFSVATAAGLDYDGFLELNPGLRCYFPHWVVGLTVCINGTTTPLAAMDLEPNFIPYYVRTNDTLAGIASRYNNTCNDVDGALVPLPTLTNNICWANGWLPGDCSDRRVVVGSMILIPCARDVGATTCSPAYESSTVNTATWLSYCCGNNGVTFISYYCASMAYATPTILDGAGCPACGSYCVGKSGSSILATYGSTVPGCLANQVCPFPQAPTAALASQRCTANGASSALCQYARYLCSVSTQLLSVIDNTNIQLTTGCSRFKTCLSTVMGYGSTLANCPRTSGLTCGTVTTYAMSKCNI